MDFNHSPDRAMLQKMLDRYLGRHYPFGTRLAISGSDAGWSAEQWGALAELGVLGALFSQEVGGYGGTGFDIAVVCEQFGKALVVEPVLGTLMAGRVLAKAGGYGAMIGDLISGTSIVTFGHAEPQSFYGLADVATRARHPENGWTLIGEKAHVPHIEAADRILLSARLAGSRTDEGGIGLFLVDRNAAGTKVRGQRLIDGGRGGALTLMETPATLVAELGYGLLEEAVAAGIVALVWEAVGTMDVLKRDTLDYLRARRQFGVPIGKFQALQHRMATMALEIEQARSAAINAAAALDGDRLKRERAVSAAKYTIGRVGTIVSEEAIQLHGGIGMTWELPLSHYAKRLTMIGHQLGDEDHHLGRFMTLGCAA